MQMWMELTSADLGAEINAAYFTRNGKSGYVLKPEMLRNKALKEGLGLITRYELDIEVRELGSTPGSLRARRVTRLRAKKMDVQELTHL